MVSSFKLNKLYNAEMICGCFVVHKENKTSILFSTYIYRYRYRYIDMINE